MQMAFRKKKGNLFDYLVCWWTGSPYFHCEIVLDGGAGKKSTCFSSSRMDGGVRTRSFILAPERWDVLDVGEDMRQNVLRVAAEQKGKKYDYLGMLFWRFPVSVESQSRWFCSEICAYALGLKDPSSYSPGSLYDYFARR